MKTCCSDFFLPPRTRRTARGARKRHPAAARRGASGAPPKRHPRAVHSRSGPGGRPRGAPQAKRSAEAESTPREARRRRRAKRVDEPEREPAPRGAADEQGASARASHKRQWRVCARRMCATPKRARAIRRCKRQVSDAQARRQSGAPDVQTGQEH